jgi:hypothetical protein
MDFVTQTTLEHPSRTKNALIRKFYKARANTIAKKEYMRSSLIRTIFKLIRIILTSPEEEFAKRLRLGSSFSHFESFIAYTQTNSQELFKVISILPQCQKSKTRQNNPAGESFTLEIPVEKSFTLENLAATTKKYNSFSDEYVFKHVFAEEKMKTCFRLFNNAVMMCNDVGKWRKYLKIRCCLCKDHIECEGKWKELFEYIENSIIPSPGELNVAVTPAAIGVPEADLLSSKDDEINYDGKGFNDDEGFNFYENDEKSFDETLYLSTSP